MCEAVYVLKMILSQLHIVLSLPLWEGCISVSGVSLFAPLQFPRTGPRQNEFTTRSA